MSKIERMRKHIDGCIMAALDDIDAPESVFEADYWILVGALHMAEIMGIVTSFESHNICRMITNSRGRALAEMRFPYVL